VGLSNKLRPSFLAVYFEGVDTVLPALLSSHAHQQQAGHNFGPVSGATNQAIQEVDSSMGALLAGLNGSGVPYDLVVLGDHGELQRTRFLVLTCRRHDIRVIGAGHPFGRLHRSRFRSLRRFGRRFPHILSISCPS
jgi:hypothetical protein